jgi:Kef-type K+ transport system membrane component KefB
MGSAWVTAKLGLQPVFGGFLAGLAMRSRDGAPDPEVIRSLERAGSLLLPLFFIVTGLSLDIGAIHGDALVLLALLCFIATVGKLAPAYAASRLSGLGPRQSSTVAVLVNTRGLTELIALNVGLSAGLINQRLFTVLVLMGLATTMMTGPLLLAIRPDRAAVPARTRRVAVPKPEDKRQAGSPQVTRQTIVP